jgi:hypothetical protein
MTSAVCDADTYLRTDEFEEAISALESTDEFLTKVSLDPYRWKWVILALHNALQGFMVLALRGSNGLLALKDDVAAKWLTAHRSGDPYPEERLDSFAGLYKKIKSERMRFYGHSKPFVPVGSQGRSVNRLDAIRDDFVHFVPKGWALDLGGLPRICADCVLVIEFLCWECGNIFWHDEVQSERVKRAISSIRTQLAKAKDVI